ncbi:hypothetical protein BKH41_00470 [Helicobacter sp. 12S02232-10]|uniref:invasion protein CiaB n=1 Tax=Helicobacter sp. 12S02232-10 TaxID=1476197 RepID=UPI000BA7974D|nr:invasion protein CiaB [Helicobacter sp. 12S02232-10]PAF49812.1 hypothetical protein BKH41_00470 [Helicobacter sp. 12S02232-10]
MQGIQNISEKFQKDLKFFYALIQKQSYEIQKIYKIFDNEDNKENEKYLKILTQLCNRIGLEPEKSVLMALCDRIANLKEGPIVQILKKYQKTNSEILIARRLLLNFVSNFYAKRHWELLVQVQKQELFNEFYRELLLGVHKIGLTMNNFFESWQDILIDGINKNMQKLYGEEKALKLLAPSMDTEESQGKLICSDRSYSIPEKLGDKFISVPYANAFDIEIKEIVKAIEKLLLNLQKHKDEIYHKQKSYIDYFTALKNAFSQKDKNRLIQSWREVDMAWMDIDTPFQVGHPLEYYEDRYRHSVAPEWDLRISNPDKIADNRVALSVDSMFAAYGSKLGIQDSLQSFVQKSLQRVKIYNGLPALYYGADMNGLFSAQVVPNDEVVSEKFGKKIFAFGDNIIQSARSKPKMKLSYETFEESYLQEARKILFENEKLWHLVYDITTNGHEFGHILWIEEDTQRLMNCDGEFKNIEEFKATCGGLVAFFESLHTQEEFEAVMSDTIRRSVGLMAWREQEEVLPYYCEGLIHLYGAFESGVLKFDPNDKPVLKIHKNKYEDLKSWYIETYKTLAKHYIEKLNAYEWLKKFVSKTEKDYRSNLPFADIFIEWYWKRYQEIGQEVL